MSHELKEGVQLKMLFLSEHMDILKEDKPFSAKEIVVTMQPGQMGMVPWAKVTHHDGRVQLFNLGRVDGVQFET